MFSPALWWGTLLAMGLLLAAAIRFAPWRALMADPARGNGWLAAIVGLMMLWLLRTEVSAGLEFHLLGVTALTLMQGWALGLLGASLALLGVTLAGWNDWAAFPFSLITVALAPVSISYLFLLLVRQFLPRHFFVFVFINAFVAGGLTGMLCGYLSAALLAASGVTSYAALEDSLLPFFPIMFFPEAVLNGWIITLLVVFKPEWVYSFRDEEYLRGK
ncbi:MAG: energy-coupling factor ABC transporter permease [Gammaproteobacteria bacterium SHHR-1]|uniref:energy-coupling factor ABC transporter permease n=1 Tax=Magnetovirga frankeli TaxID=947516 RepID=UPI00326FBD1C